MNLSSKSQQLAKSQILKTKKTTNCYMGFVSGGLTCKFGVLCFYSSSVLIDRFVLLNSPERKTRKHGEQV